MRKSERYAAVIAWFRAHMPVAETELHYTTPFELLMAVVLSAQCTDKRVNAVSPALFRAFPTPESLAASTAEEVRGYIRSVSYPNSKATHLVGLGQVLVERFGSTVPGTLDELMELPGVGRKTANVILSVVFGQAAMAVDTHVYRLSHRLGLVGPRCTTPLSVEKELMKHIDPRWVPIAHHWLILHGRYTCLARAPRCGDCGLQEVCKYYAKGKKVSKKAAEGKN